MFQDTNNNLGYAKRLPVIKAYSSMTTKHPIEHMLAIHSCNKQGKVIQRTQSILEQQQRAVATYNVVTAFDVTKFWAILLRWIVNTHISFSEVEHPEFRKLLLYCNALFMDILPLSHNMISS